MITFDGVRNGETFVKPVSFKASCVDKNIDLQSLEFHIFALSGQEVTDERLMTDLSVDYVNSAPFKAVKIWKDSLFLPIIPHWKALTVCFSEKLIGL